MTHDPRDRPTDAARRPGPSAGPPPRQSVVDPLTPAQREFARLLGRLLADLWERERRAAAPPPRDTPPP